MKAFRAIASAGAARWLRVGLAVLFFITGLVEREPVALLAAGFFGLQALFKVGCCGAVCVPRRPAAPATPQDVVYEELR